MDRAMFPFTLSSQQKKNGIEIRVSYFHSRGRTPNLTTKNEEKSPAAANGGGGGETVANPDVNACFAAPPTPP